MPRKVDYPWASLARALDAASAVDSLGGKCSTEMCAEKMGMKVGGGFKSIISAAAKYNLIDNNKGSLMTSQLYKSIKLSYNEEEKLKFKKEAFLSVPAFHEVYERFRNQRLPVEFFDRLLVREFQVESSVANRVATYFIEGAQQVGILDDNNLLVEEEKPTKETEEVELVKTEGFVRDNIKLPSTIVSEVSVMSDFDEYIVHIKGPGIDTKILIKEEEDIDIVNLTLNKIKKKLPL